MTPRAAFATEPAVSRGRLYPEPPSKSRTPFARDRDRIIHSTAFRRLKEKTQVFVAHEGDHYRTRLTHSLEVAQIARSLAVALGLDADLAETIALAHDLGHPPFGHAGEEALESCMEGLGGFDHNVQTFRVVTELERRYPAFNGLNLTWETLEGVIKHNGPVAMRLDRPAYYPVAAFDAVYPLELSGWAGPEAQLAALADDIAYNNHDVDDGVAAGLFGLEELAQIPLIGPILHGVRADWPGLEARLTRLEAVRRMIGAMIDDVLAETRMRVARAGVETAADVRAMDHGVVGFSAEMTRDLAELRLFLHSRMYRHFLLNRMRSRAKRTVTDLFDLFMADPGVLPTEWFERLPRDGEVAGRARVVCDYIGGMTDRYAIEEHRRLFNVEAWG